jgi:transposase
MLKDVLNLSLSEGTIFNIIESMSNKAQPIYQEIKNRVSSSQIVGGDETGAHVNKNKMWFWVFQNKSLTFIVASLSRSYQTIVDNFSEGFPVSIYVSDSLPAQLKIDTLGKQLCLAHLMRELKNFEASFQSQWAGELKQLFKKAIDYKKAMQNSDYSNSNSTIKELECNLSLLLDRKIEGRHKKESAFVRRLIKNRSSILTFLYFKDAPSDNNGSERAIRNVKVKMKISNQFKSFEFAQHYAVIRSVVDTTIKNSMNVFNALTNLANQEVVKPAE